MILVEMENADKDKIKNFELLGELKTSVTFCYFLQTLFWLVIGSKAPIWWPITQNMALPLYPGVTPRLTPYLPSLCYVICETISVKTYHIKC